MTVSLLLLELLALAVQVAAVVFFRYRIGKGRILTRPLWRFRLFRPYVCPFTGQILAGNSRLGQLLIGTPIQLSLVFFVGSAALSSVWWILLAAFYLDDYVTGDDDRWRRFKSFARNLFRWRMELPQEV